MSDRGSASSTSDGDHRRDAAQWLWSRFGGIAYGGDYNPEQWPEEVWEEDVRLMAEARVNLVTVGVFSWSRLQPTGPGELSAVWLDRVLDLLHEAGVRVDLSTATASPPAWLVRAHPEILPMTVDGRRLGFGARQHYCPSSPAYREAAVDLAGRLAERYGSHPAVVLWHIGNEYGCHVPACYCARSAAAFRVWLAERYGTTDRLNEAWGGAVWSQDYSSFEEVDVPRSAPTFANPTQQLDFARFSSDELLACLLAEREVLRSVAPQIPVTTNFMGLFRPVDQHRWARELDVTAVDSYPDPADPDSYLESALAFDLTRSVGGGRPWLLMEQAPSAVSWRDVNVPKAPGQYRGLSLQAVARGGDAVLAFQWRAAAAGAEKFHSGMVPHAGRETRVWREVVALGADLDRLSSVAGTEVTAEVGFVLDWESWWGLELDSHPSGALALGSLLMELYRPLAGAGATVDIVHPELDLSRYRLVLVPMLYSVTDQGAANVQGFVERGGTAVVTFFSGIVDADDHVRLGGYPAPWKELLGLSVEEFAPLSKGETVKLEGSVLAGEEAHGRLWSDAVDLHGASSLLSYQSGHLRGRPAVTEHAYGEGTAVYVGTLPDRVTLAALLGRAARRSGIERWTPLPAGIESVRRGSHRFVINHRDEPAELLLDDQQFDLLTGTVVGPRVVLGPRDALVLTEQQLSS